MKTKILITSANRSIRLLLCLVAMMTWVSSLRAQVANDNSFSQMVLDRVIKDIIPPHVTGPTGLNYDDLQVNSVPTAFSKDSKYETYVLSKYVDTISPTGFVFKSTPNQFTKQYSLFIRQVGIPQSDKALAPQLVKARKAYEAAVKAYGELLSQYAPEYETFHKSQVRSGISSDQWLSLTDWLSQNYGNLLASAQQDRDTKGQDWIALANQASKEYRAIANSIVAYDNIGNQRNVLIQDTEDRQLIRFFTAVPSIKEFVTQAQTISGVGHKWDYSNKSGWSSTETTTISGSAGIFGVGVSGGGSKTTIKNGEDEFGFSLAFKHWGRAAIKPGDWFDSSVITDFAYGPFADPKIKTKADADMKFWSQTTGSLPWMVSELVLVYKPIIVIKMSHHTYEDLKSTFGGSASLNIGCFSFGASAGGSKEDIKWDDSSNSLTAEGPDAPQILAVVETRLPNFK